MGHKKKKKKVGYILRKFPVLSETFILNEILELEAQGIEVEIFSIEKPNDPRFHKDLHRLKAEVHYIPGFAKFKSLWKQCVKASKKFKKGHRKALFYTLRQANPTLLLRFLQSCYIANEASKRGIYHFHAHFATRATSIAFLASMITETRYSFTAHAVDIFKETLSQEALKRKIEYSDFVITVSEFNKNYLSKIAPLVSHKIIKIHNGIDLSEFREASPEEQEPFSFLCVARFVEKKGHKILVEACEILKKQGVSFNCRLIGQGNLQGAIESAIKEKGLSNHVSILGAKSHDEVKKWYSQSHAYILPCITGKDGNKDGLPVAIVEALASGLPVITTPMTGNPEVVKHLENGILVPFSDPAATADAMLKIVKDKNLYYLLSGKARQSIEKQFNIKETAKSLVAKFEEVRK